LETQGLPPRKNPLKRRAYFQLTGKGVRSDTKRLAMPVVAQPAERVRFGDFEANLATGELRKHGVRVKLHDQPFQILAMLISL